MRNDDYEREKTMKTQKDGQMMTTFRAIVSEKQLDDIMLPEPERLSKRDAMALANWAVTHGVPADDDPSQPARIRDMFGFRAALILPHLKKSLADRIGTHVAIAARHSLIVELDIDDKGQFFQVGRKRVKAPDLTIRHESAMMLLEAMGMLSPLPNEDRDVSLIGSRLSKSQAKCVDICMGHYHERLGNVVTYAENNKATMIGWRTFDPRQVADPFEPRKHG